MVDWTKSCRLAATDHHMRQLPVGLFVHVDVIVLNAVSMRREEGRVGGGGGATFPSRGNVTHVQPSHSRSFSHPVLSHSTSLPMI